MLACYEWAWKYRNDTIVFSFLWSKSTKKSLIVCSRDFVCTIKTGVETSRWISTIVPASQASECYPFSADLWPGFRWNVASIRMASCIALTQAECNLPAFIQAILRIVFYAFFAGRSGSSKEEICPDIILCLSPSDFSLKKTSCHGANSIVVSSDTAHENNCRSWWTVARKKFSGRNSLANKVLGIVRNGKGLFFAATSAKNSFSERLSARYSTTPLERAARQSRRWQNGLLLDKCSTLYQGRHRGPPKWFS